MRVSVKKGVEYGTRLTLLTWLIWATWTLQGIKKDVDAIHQGLGSLEVKIDGQDLNDVDEQLAKIQKLLKSIDQRLPY